MIRVQLAKPAGKRVGAKHCAIEYAESAVGEVPSLYRCLPTDDVSDEIARAIATALSNGVRAGALQGYH